jgi:hypothetical protein
MDDGMNSEWKEYGRKGYGMILGAISGFVWLD